MITLQANLPSLRLLQSQAYNPREVVVDVLSGIGTVLGSFLGPTGVSLSLLATSMLAGPGAGEHAIRHRSIYSAGGAALLIGLLAGIVPSVLLVTLARLSVVNVFGNALRQLTERPLLLGPVFALAVALSDISFLGFGNYFWSLLIGTAVSLILERDGFRALREGGDEGER